MTILLLATAIVAFVFGLCAGVVLTVALTFAGRADEQTLPAREEESQP